MKKLSLTLVFVSLVAVLAAVPAAATKRKCLLIGAPAGAENAEFDRHISPRLEAWGYTVETRNSSELPKLTSSDYAPYDFIFLSETTHSSHMAPLRQIPKPMLCSDGWAAKESALAFGTGDPVGILEPAHPVVFLEGARGHDIASGHAPGTVTELATVEKEAQPALLIWGRPGIPVIAVAGVKSDPTKLAVYGVEKGTLNAKGEKIPHRVAVIGIHAWGYDDLTPAGEDVFKAAIEWILKE